VRAALAVLAVLAAIVVPVSDARFNARSTNTATIGAANATSYFHLYSRDTLPPPDPGCWLFQYAVRRGSNPQVLAASGSDRTIAVHLGGWRGQQGLARCVLAIRAPAAFPPGVGQITLQTRIGADAATGRRPVTGASFRRVNGLTNSEAIALAPEQQVSLELDIDLQPGFTPPNRLYTQVVTVWATWAGNGDDFFSFDIPVKVYDGAGAGPN
jgi:hypothetical protein